MAFCIASAWWLTHFAVSCNRWLRSIYDNDVVKHSKFLEHFLKAEVYAAKVNKIIRFTATADFVSFRTFRKQYSLRTLYRETELLISFYMSILLYRKNKFIICNLTAKIRWLWFSEAMFQLGKKVEWILCLKTIY